MVVDSALIFSHEFGGGKLLALDMDARLELHNFSKYLYRIRCHKLCQYFIDIYANNTEKTYHGK